MIACLSVRGGIRPLVLLGMLATTHPLVQAEGHRFAMQGNGKLAIVEKDGAVSWEMPWGGLHDLHRLPNGNLLATRNNRELCEIEIASKRVVRTYDSGTANGNQGRKVEVHAFQPLSNDRWMIAESGAVRVIEIDSDGKLLKQFPLKVDHPHPHRDTRLVRRLPNGNTLACHEGDGVVREYDGLGEVVWEFETPLFGESPRDGHGPEAFGNQVFAAVRLANGNTLVATGNGHSILEVEPDRKIVWKVAQNDLPGITLAWVTTLEVLPNGNYVVGNCHAGPNNPLLIEIEPSSRTVVWQYDGFAEFGNSASNSLILDEPTRR